MYFPGISLIYITAFFFTARPHQLILTYPTSWVPRWETLPALESTAVELYITALQAAGGGWVGHSQRAAGRLSEPIWQQVFVVSLRAVSQFPYWDPFHDSQVHLLALQQKRCFYQFYFRKPHLGSENLSIGAFLVIKIWYSYNVTGNHADKAKPICLLAGPLLSVWPTGGEKRLCQEQMYSGRPRESRSAEWSRCHLDIHFTDSNHNLPFIWYPALGRRMGKEHHTKRKHVYPVQITALLGCCC